MVDVDAAKREVRRGLRMQRRALVAADEGGHTGLGARSAAIMSRLIDLDRFQPARGVLAYDALPGEVSTDVLRRWCSTRGIEWAEPAANPAARIPDLAETCDVIVVPSLAATSTGSRLGQGGGWYDRLLPRRAVDCVVFAPVFREFVTASLPCAEHDAPVDCVVSDDAAWWAP